MNTTYYCIGLMSVVYIIVILFVIIKANSLTEFIIAGVGDLATNCLNYLI